MEDSQFQELVEEEFVRIEDQIDELEVDADIDTSGDVLTITLENGTSIILSRQVANHEIWVAAKSGGFHLAYDGNRWFCATTDEDLDTLMDRVFQEQAGVPLYQGS